MMTKKFTYLLILAVGLILSANAHADIEAPQTVIGVVKTVIEEARAVQEELNSVQEELRSAAEGIAGPVKDAVKTVNDVKSEVEDGVNQVKDGVDQAKGLASDPTQALNGMGKLPSFISEVDTNNSEEVKQAVQKNYFMQRPKSSQTSSEQGQTEEAATTDLVEINKAQEEKMNEVQRENFANLYASAFTIRTNLAKEEAEDKDKENTRDIIQSTKEKAMEMAKRFRKLMMMESMLFEFNATQQARQFSYSEEDEDE